ncbi:MAG: hypothetical protein RLZZ23_1971, partial [Verrucomicrobiota bacterium]
LGSLFLVQGITAQKRWEMHSQVSGLGRQVPGSGIQHQVQVRDLYPHPHPTTRT